LRSSTLTCLLSRIFGECFGDLRPAGSTTVLLFVTDLLPTLVLLPFPDLGETLFIAPLSKPVLTLGLSVLSVVLIALVLSVSTIAEAELDLRVLEVESLLTLLLLIGSTTVVRFVVLLVTVNLGELVGRLLITLVILDESLLFVRLSLVNVLLVGLTIVSVVRLRVAVVGLLVILVILDESLLFVRLSLLNVFLVGLTVVFVVRLRVVAVPKGLDTDTLLLTFVGIVRVIDLVRVGCDVGLCLTERLGADCTVGEEVLTLRFVLKEGADLVELERLLLRVDRLIDVLVDLLRV